MVLLLLPATVGIVLFGAVRPWSMGSILVFVFIGIALYLLRPILNQHVSELRIPPGGLLFLVMMLYTALSMPIASVPYEARIALLKLASYVGAYWAWTEWASRFGRWRILLFVPLLLGTLVALYAIVQHVQGSNMVLNMPRHEQYGMRASGTFRAPAYMGAYMGTIICLALSLMLMPAAGAFLRIFSGYSLLLCFPVLYLSESRSGWVGTVLGVPVVLLLIMARKSMRAFLITLIALPLLGGAVLGSVWAASPMFQQRIQEAINAEGSAGWRLDTWRDTMVMIQDAPILGFGPGSYKWRYSPYQTWETNIWVDYTHNEYLQLWAEYGLVGLIIMLLIVGSIVYHCLRSYLKAELSRDICLTAGFLGALVAALGHAIFDFNLHVLSLVHLLVLYGGVTMGGLCRSGLIQTRELPQTARWWLQLPLLVLTCWALVASLQHAVAGTMVRLAEDDIKNVNLLAPDPYGVAERRMRIAARMDPGFWEPHLQLGDLQRRRAFWIREPELREQKLQQALAHYYRAHSLNPYDMNPVYGLGRTHFLLGNEELSLQYLHRTVEHAPMFTFFHIQFGLQLRQMGYYEEALEMFIRARRAGAGQEPVVRSNIRWLQQQLREP